MNSGGIFEGKTHFLAHDIYKKGKICIIRNRNMAESKCVFCEQFVDIEIGTQITRQIIHKLEENGIIESTFARGERFSVFFEDKSDQYNQIICFDCLPKTSVIDDDLFYRLNDRIFEKNWLLNHGVNESNFYQIFGDHKDPNMPKRIFRVIQRLTSKMEHEMTTKISKFGLFGYSEPTPSLFEFSGERLHTLCGLTDDDVIDLMSYLQEFSYKRNFIRSLTVKEALLAYFYFIRQNCSLNVLKEHINDKKSTLNNHCVIKSETVSNIIYRIAYVLGGPNKTPKSELKGQFYRSFKDNSIFQNTLRPLGSFTTDFLGWDQRQLNPEFLLSDACTTLQKCKESMTSADILDYYKTFSDLNDEHIQDWVRGLMSSNIVIAVDASYLYCKKPDDMIQVKKLYSMHKKRHLTKFMLYVSSKGYIFDLSTSWATDGAHNDAKILHLEMTQNKNLKLFFGQMKSIGMKIVLIGDRGFRDSIAPTLELFPNSVELVIPPLQGNQLNSKGKQKASKRNTANKLSNEKANDARIVSQDRSIIENMNRCLKTFKFFQDIVELEYVFNGFQGVSLRIVASIMNRRFIRNGWIQRDSSPKICRLNLLKAYYVARYKERKFLREPKLMFVQTIPKIFTYHKKGNDVWLNIGPDTEFFDEFKKNFPLITFTSIKMKGGKKTVISDTDLVHFALGEYHCLNARRYIATEEYTKHHFYIQQLHSYSEQTKKSPEISEIYDMLFKKYPDWSKRGLNLLRFLIPAQFSPNDHKVFLIYSKNHEIPSYLSDEPDAHFLSRIVDYYCDCMTGARSLGSCSHVCAALLGAGSIQRLSAKHANREILDEQTYVRASIDQDDTVIEDLPVLEPIIFNEKPDDLASEPEDQTELILKFEKDINEIDKRPIPENQE